MYLAVRAGAGDPAEAGPGSVLQAQPRLRLQGHCLQMDRSVQEQENSPGIIECKCSYLHIGAVPPGLDSAVGHRHHVPLVWVNAVLLQGLG